MKNHWGFLEQKLGKDIVRYCIQPMLLPVEGRTISELRRAVFSELNLFCPADKNTPWPREVKEQQADPTSLLHYLVKAAKHLPWMCIGSNGARAAKFFLTKRIRKYRGRPEFKPSQVASWWREEDKIWPQFPSGY